MVQHQDSDVGFDNAPVRRNETTYVGVDITVPLYAGGSNLAGLREAKSLHSIAKSELQQIKLDTSELVRSAYLQFKSSEQTIRAAEVLVESTKATADAMQKGFELGTVTNVDVLNAIAINTRQSDASRNQGMTASKLILSLSEKLAT